MNLDSLVLAGDEGPPRQAVTTDRSVFQSYVGQYEVAPKMLLTLRLEKQHLLAQLSGQPAFEVFPENETKFFWKIVKAQFTITKDEMGNVIGLVIEQGGAKFNAKKISNELPKFVELPETEDLIESPLLVVLAKELKNGNQAALARFWDDIQG